MPRIGKVNLENNIILAPLHGVNNVAFRMQCKQHGAGLVYTSMIHPDALFNQKDKLDVIKEERPLTIQLVGKDQEKMAEATRQLEDKCDIIDINLGCPDQDVLAAKAGAFLIKHPEQAEKMISKVVSSVNIPVTAKIRIGWDEKTINAVPVAKMLENLGIAAIAVHARTRKQVYSGKADWNVIKQVKDSVNIPVIGNGDIFEPRDYKAMIEKTNVDFVMVGRGAMGNPLIFENSLRYYKGETLLQKDAKMTSELYYEFCNLYKKYSNRFIISELRQHAMWLVKGLNNSAVLRNKLSTLQTEDEIKKVMDRL